VKSFLISAIAVVGLAMPVSARTLTDDFSSYYAFGDSLTDDGKLGVLGAPSLDGRFSNGPTYAEFIADIFTAAGKDTGNLAIGGATAGDVNPAAFSPLSTFSGQIAAFSGALSSGFGPNPGSNPLVSVLFGANDFFQGQDVIAAADAVATGIRTIGTIAGQTFNDFLVVSLPDIGGTPAFAGAGAPVATAATNAFNMQLARNIIDLRAEGFNIITLETAGVINDILDDIALGGPKFGVLNSTTPCTVSMSVPGPSCVDLGIDPNTLLFNDAVHPNAVAQRLLGDAALTKLAAIPLPATHPLLLTVVAGFGIAANRRRRAA
jgi:phospholipase/lecithinase/hemolysin